MQGIDMQIILEFPRSSVEKTACYVLWTENLIKHKHPRRQKKSKYIFRWLGTYPVPGPEMSPMTSSRHAVHVHVPCTNFTAQVLNSTPKLCLPIMLCTSWAKINDAFSNFSQPSCSKIKLLQTNPGYNWFMFQGNHFLLFPPFFNSHFLWESFRTKDHHHDIFSLSTLNHLLPRPEAH